MMFDMSTYERCRSAKLVLSQTEAKAAYADDVFGARLGGEHAQDASTTADIEHDLVLEQMGVLDDRVSVRSRADGVFQHLFVNAYKT